MFTHQVLKNDILVFSCFRFVSPYIILISPRYFVMVLSNTFAKKGKPKFNLREEFILIHFLAFKYLDMQTDFTTGR
jgi:hypothetical protein